MAMIKMVKGSVLAVVKTTATTATIVWGFDQNGSGRKLFCGCCRRCEGGSGFVGKDRRRCNSSPDGRCGHPCGWCRGCCGYRMLKASWSCKLWWPLLRPCSKEQENQKEQEKQKEL
eukprot:TRINITY_DN8390_c0_g2_i6.p3 TRINITY_DN8390_c0_g2~~TRINITY_DN8390_c0_g2_i6.p3  ORF type:complete len:116 (-),score=16.14 TRINITY_DN8390_c0_g2_i6:363-710(-)